MTTPSTPRLLLAALLGTSCGNDPAAGDSATTGTGDTTTGDSASTTPPTTASTAATDPDATSSSSPSDGTSTAASSESSTSAGGSSDGGELSPGCGNAAAATGELFRSMMIQGVERTYIVDAPAVIDPDAPLALAFVFHGNGGNGQGSQSMGLQNVLGAQDQAVFVFPDGLQYLDFGVGWNLHCDEYDMEFFDTMIAELSEEFCIDPARIFGAGFSWGGDMTEALACCRGDIVRAIAPASGPGVFPFDGNDMERPAVRMTYSTNDAYPAYEFAAAIDFYRAEHGCSDTVTPVDPAPCVAYDDCAKPLVACEYEGLGHAWPADWADETWAFFSQF
jgi:polyhydroxybutyrate depolymerase